MVMIANRTRPSSRHGTTKGSPVRIGATAVLIAALSGCQGAASPVARVSQPTIRYEGPTQEVYNPESKEFTLSSGDYVLEWSTTGPFVDLGDGFGAICTVNIDLFDATGEYAGGVKGVSEAMSTPQSGSRLYPGLTSGSYTLFLYNGCPWSVGITRRE